MMDNIKNPLINHHVMHLLLLPNINPPHPNIPLISKPPPNTHLNKHHLIKPPWNKTPNQMSHTPYSSYKYPPSKNKIPNLKQIPFPLLTLIKHLDCLPQIYQDTHQNLPHFPPIQSSFEHRTAPSTP